MPAEPSTYQSGPVSPQQLDTDLYSSNGTGFGANGILFLSHRQTLCETLTASRNLAVSTAGTWNQIEGTGTDSYNMLDTSALFGLGSDAPGIHPAYHFAAAGNNQYLVAHFVAVPGFTVAAAAGAGMYLQSASTATSSFFNQGAIQKHSSTHDGCAPYIDLLNINTPTPVWRPAAFLAAASGTVSALVFNGNDTAGETTRATWIWAGLATGGSTVTSVPAPAMNWGTVTSAALNTAVGSAMTFLYTPPMLRVSQNLTTSIPNTTGTKVPWTAAPSVDTYSGWGTATSTYTAQLPGLYLAAPTVTFTANGTGSRFCGLKLTYGGTGTSTNYQGPYYGSVTAGAVTSVIQTRVLDLQAGDTVSAYCSQNSGGAVTLAGASLNTRFVMAYLGPYAAAGTTLTYTAPNTAFRWMAGQASGQPLLSLLNTHLGNDINFLVSRPYFTGYQGTAQTGFTNNSGFHQVTIDTVGGLYHGAAGDNYGGWSASSHRYAAQVPGWYLVIAEVFATNPTLTTGYITAGIFCNTSGGEPPSNSPDWYQHTFFSSTTDGPPGAVAVGLYYLAAGEYVYPMIQTQDWTGTTWGTSVQSGSGVFSQFTVIWQCE